MCGITGFAHMQENFEAHYEKWMHTLDHMTQTLVRRGPDNQGLYLKRNVALGHRRLSIRDIERGAQPMFRRFHNAEYAVCYNGEIYNTKELQEDLEKKGYNFYTTCDTEVILVGMVHYGPAFIQKLNGIFAFAFWDPSKEQIMLVRDRAGVKPLFYSVENDYLVFGSELKALLEFPYIKPQLDREGLCEIFGLGPARSADHGIFKNVKGVLPGHYMVFDCYGIRDIRYWNLESWEHEDSYEDTVEKVRYLVEDAITKQMVSDVPVCSFLSGGVDSSIVTAISSNYLKKTTGEPLHTFSFDFAGNDKYFKSNAFQPDRDRPWVEKMVAQYGTKHTFLECNNEDLADYLYKAVDAKDLPGMADVDASMLYFCEQVKQTHKVTLTGECADEIFGGYPWFHKKEMFETDAFPWSSNMETRKLLLHPEFRQELPLDAYAKAAYEKSIAEVPVLASDSAEEKRRRELAYLNIKWFMATLLDRMDRTSMYTGLEARVPFADHRIMDYVFNVPWSIKNKDGMVKHLLRKSAEGILSDELLYRKKSPYPKTYNPGYERILGERMNEILSDRQEPMHRFLNREMTARFLEAPADYGKPWFGQLMAGPQLIAYMLQVNYWLKKYNVEVLV